MIMNVALKAGRAPIRYVTTAISVHNRSQSSCVVLFGACVVSFLALQRALNPV